MRVGVETDMPFTDAFVRSIKPRAKPFKLAGDRSLYLLVQPSGSKLWRFNYEFAKRRKTLAIGIYPEISLAQAREARDVAKIKLRSGVDPSAEVRAKKQAMIEAQVQLDYVNRFTDSRGKLRHSFRRKGHKRVTIKGQPGSDEFMENYHALLERTTGTQIKTRTEKTSIPEIRGSRVYFIRVGKAVKIGVTINLKQRIKDFQIVSAEEIRTLAVFPGNRRTESLLHKLFAEERIRNELFRFDYWIDSFLTYAKAESFESAIERTTKAKTEIRLDQALRKESLNKLKATQRAKMSEAEYREIVAERIRQRDARTLR